MKNCTWHATHMAHDEKYLLKKFNKKKNNVVAEHKSLQASKKQNH